MVRGTSQTLSYALESIIDEYKIYICTLTLAGAAELFVNGVSQVTATGVGVMSGLAAIGYLGANNTPAQYGVDKSILVGLINGALTGQDALILSRRIDQRYGLGLSI